MYKLVLIRHGESTWNLENRFTGWTDVDLTDTCLLYTSVVGVTRGAPLPHLRRILRHERYPRHVRVQTHRQ